MIAAGSLAGAVILFQLADRADAGSAAVGTRAARPSARLAGPVERRAPIV